MNSNRAVAVFVLGFLFAHYGIAGGGAVSWEKVSAGGLTTPDNKSTFPGKVYNDALYVGTWNDQGAEIWRVGAGTNAPWYEVSSSGFGVPQNTYPSAMEVFQDRLYVSVLNSAGAQLWFTGDGSSWSRQTVPGLNLTRRTIRAMSTFTPAGSRECLLVGADSTGGAELWMTDDAVDWLRVEEKGLGDGNNTAVYSMAEFQGALYLGTVNQQRGTQIWKTKGGIDWSQVKGDGFGYPGNWATYSMCTFNNYLYAGTVNQLTGTQVWRTPDGVTWFQSNSDGFGKPDNVCSYCMAVFNNHLYVGTGGTAARVWRTADGVVWEKAAPDGFGTDENIRVHSLAAYGGYLYAATANLNGTELWRLAGTADDVPPCFLEQVVEDEPETLGALRRIRDRVMKRCPGGARHVELYYRYSPELVNIYNARADIRHATHEVLNQVLPEVLRLASGEIQEFNSTLANNLFSLLEQYANAACPASRLSMLRAIKQVKDTGLSSWLGPAINAR